MLFCLFKGLLAQQLYTIDSLNHYEDMIRILRGSDSAMIDTYKDKIIQIVNESYDSELLFLSYKSLGNIDRYNNQYDQAIYCYFKALSLSKYATSPLDIADIYDNLARIYMTKGDAGLMFESINKSLAIRKHNGDERGQHLTKQILSSHYRSTGNFAEVLRNSFNALNYFTNQADTIQIASTYNSIGVTYKTLQNYTKALYYYEQSEFFYKSINNLKGESTILNNIGTIYLNQGKYQTALENFNKSLEIEQHLGNTSQAYTRYNNIGLAYTYLGNYATAKMYIEQCIEHHKASGAIVRLANSYDSMAQLFDNIGITDSTEHYLLKSLELSTNLNIKSLQSSVTYHLSQLYFKNGNLSKAYSMLDKHTQLLKDLQLNISTQRFTEEEFNYLREKDAEIINTEERKTLYKQLTFSSALIIVVLISIIIIVVQANKSRLAKRKNYELTKEVKTQKDELLIQNQELLSKTLKLGNDNSEITFAIQQLEKLKEEFGIQGKQKIQKVIQNLEVNKNNDIWEEFEIRFSLVNSHFYEMLLAACPTITINEKRLAALLYLNFSTKEIARILKQNHRSILVAKSRLRKKMNVPDGMELSNFIFELATPA